jgi:hypothetical protein
MGFNRFRRPLTRQSPIEQALVQARRQIRAGHYARAGMILSELARGAEALGRPKIAAELHSRAAHCFIDGGAEPSGLVESRAALRVFRNLGLTERYARFLGNILRKLQAHGMTSGIGMLRTEFDGAEVAHPAAPTPARSLHLPEACTQCGAPLRGDEVEWVDAYSVECNYCGAVVQGKEN